MRQEWLHLYLRSFMRLHAPLASSRWTLLLIDSRCQWQEMGLAPRLSFRSL